MNFFRKMPRYGRVLVILTIGIAIILAWAGIRGAWIKRVTLETTPAMKKHVAAVEILRDKYGVPHIFGKTDADAAFGFAYAHAEDDWPLIQGILAAARGRLSTITLSSQALGNDFMVGLLRVWPQVESQYETALSPEMRAVMEAYAAGLNYYAVKHPHEVDGRLLPIRGKDIAAGFVHKVPLFMRFHQVLGYLNASPHAAAGKRIALEPKQFDFMLASNSHAVSARRSADGIPRLNVNSHQPWKGPVAWYEAHIRSEEGWNMSGGTFPGAPFILMGHNDHLGWTHTVNTSDYIDVYKLRMHPDGSPRYLLDGAWKKLEVEDVRIEIDLGVFTLPITTKAFRSPHGPVFKTKHGFYAIRYSGMGRLIGAAEQWYRMGKARNFREWRKAMERHAIPMMNTIYADKENIYYVYNALLPLRKPGHDWKAILPGDSSDLIWKDYLPFNKLPQVLNPPSGFLQNCNNSPFFTTDGAGNPNPIAYAKELGIDDRITNRALRSMETFGADKSISGVEFLRYKWDRDYSPKAPIFWEAVDPLLKTFVPRTAAEREGIKLLRNWNRHTGPNSRAASLAILTWRPIWEARVVKHHSEFPLPADTFRAAVKYLMKHYGKLDVPIDVLQRLRRGDLDLPLAGGPDVLNAIHSKEDGKGKLVGTAGDSYVMIVEFTKDGPRSRSIHQYGNVNRPKSPHYADQAELFTQRRLKPVWRTRAQVEANLSRKYRPGEEKP